MSRPRVLVVDDEEPMRVTIAAMVTHFGYEVSLAADGREALAAHRAQPADLLLTDLFMPGKEGIETIREFRRDYPQVRIIAMSGGSTVTSSSGREDYLEMARRMGAHRFLTKPFKPADLQAALAELCGQSRPDAADGSR